MADLQEVDEQPELIHSDIISEMPWVKNEDMYDQIFGPTSIGKTEKPPSYVELSTKVRGNAGLYTDDQAREVTRKGN